MTITIVIDFLCFVATIIFSDQEYFFIKFRFDFFFEEFLYVILFINFFEFLLIIKFVSNLIYCYYSLRNILLIGFFCY